MLTCHVTFLEHGDSITLTVDSEVMGYVIRCLADWMQVVKLVSQESTRQNLDVALCCHAVGNQSLSKST